MTEPKSKPILFSAPMVRALLDGTKTQTRRIVKPQVHWVKDNPQGQVAMIGNKASMVHALSPYGAPGDTLWVKETWNSSNQWNVMKPTAMPEGAPIFYGADYDAAGLRTCGPWRPSLFMRRWMSRITLEIVSVRVERVQDISEAAAVAEGCTPTYSHAGYDVTTDRVNCFIVEGFVGGIPKAGDEWQGMKVEHVQPHPARQIGTARDEYRRLWNRLNGPSSWEANPWVWVVEFRRVQP